VQDIFTPIERAIRLFVYRHFLDTGSPPDADTIARDTGVAPGEVASALRRLADARALVLAPASLNIWMAHPFSAVPTAYPVDVQGRTYWANCAWDAVAVPALVGADGGIRTRCADCGAEIAVKIRCGRPDGDAVIHFAVPPRRFWDNVAYT
jgi:hypothetical protein